MSTSSKVDQYYRWTRHEMLEFVPQGVKRVLDVGCGVGGFGAMIKSERGAEVWGIEISQPAADEARQHLDRIDVGDVNQILDSYPKSSFDAIAFNDVLEHLVDPYSLLGRLPEWLTPNGVIVASLPNIRYYKALKHILFQKDWKYEDAGIFDRTHLRFFTLKSMLRMWDECGYEVEAMHGINGTHAALFTVINGILLGSISDSRYQQFGFRVRPRQRA